MLRREVPCYNEIPLQEMGGGHVMIRVIAIDLDDTLIAPDKHIPGPNKTAVRAAQEAGIHVVIATARGWTRTEPIYRELGLDTPAIIASGARLMNEKGRVLWERALPIDFCREVVQFCDDNNIALRMYVGEEVWNNKSHDPLVQHRITNEIRVEEIAKNLQIAPFQIYTKGHREAELLQERFGDEGEGYRCNVLTYSDGVPEVCMLHPLSSKVAALSALCAEWGIPREQVMAIGDSVNDLPMIEWAGLGVAMSWAPEFIRQRADVVTTKGNPAGVSEVIRKVLQVQGNIKTASNQ
jgi:Cof subfamily protein (haloacid dehalogenase superfamily)